MVRVIVSEVISGQVTVEMAEKEAVMYLVFLERTCIKRYAQDYFVLLITMRVVHVVAGLSL